MATTLKQTEAAPVAYPAQPDGLSAGAAAIDLAMIWQRIEAFTAWRFTARNVVWLVEGPGEWEAPLAPVTISQVEMWTDGAWAEAAPAASPMGYDLACAGPYRFTGSVGGGTVPAAVSEAYKRLAEYIASADSAPAGASDYSASLGNGAITTSFSRAPTWIARAMVNSGAADLLRPYRRCA